MKHRYEGLLVLNIKGKEDGAQKVIDRLEKDFKTAGGDVESVQKMDSRHFTYVKGDLASGFYVNFVFGIAPTALATLQAKFKLDEEVYRQNYVRLSDKKKAA